MKRVSLVLTLAVAAGFSAQTASAQTLKTIQDRGMLSCGVSQGLPGFSSPDDKGVESLARQIKMTGRAYPLFDIAQMILQKPERHTVTFKINRTRLSLVELRALSATLRRGKSTSTGLGSSIALDQLLACRLRCSTT